MLRRIIVLTAAVTSICAQAPVAPYFEAVSIRPSQADSNAGSGIRTLHDRLDGNNVTLKRCIRGAYGVSPHQIVGGPDWIDTERFQIAAKADRLINDDAVFMKMLQTVLAERFKLSFHRETTQMSAYVLEVVKAGARLPPATGGEAFTNMIGTNLTASIDADNTNLDAFARALSTKVDLPVINKTALPGRFKIKLSWSLDTKASADMPTVFTAIQEQLGLRLRAAKVPVEIIVVDHAEKPSAN